MGGAPLVGIQTTFAEKHPHPPYKYKGRGFSGSTWGFSSTSLFLAYFSLLLLFGSLHVSWLAKTSRVARLPTGWGQKSPIPEAAARVPAQLAAVHRCDGTVLTVVRG